jgi:hypothetical protein
MNIMSKLSNKHIMLGKLICMNKVKSSPKAETRRSSISQSTTKKVPASLLV